MRDDMTIDKLIEKLQEARETLGGDAAVRIAYQQNYPIAGVIAAVTEFTEDMAGEDEGAHEETRRKQLWIAAGSMPYNENPYGPSWAWNGNL